MSKIVITKGEKMLVKALIQLAIQNGQIDNEGFETTIECEVASITDNFNMDRRYAIEDYARAQINKLPRI